MENVKEKIELTDLQADALKCYFKHNENTIIKYVKSAVEKILNAESIEDIRDKGYYCYLCSRTSKNETAFSKKDTVSFGNGVKICNSHYDGCRGWD